MLLVFVSFPWCPSLLLVNSSPNPGQSEGRCAQGTSSSTCMGGIEPPTYIYHVSYLVRNDNLAPRGVLPAGGRVYVAPQAPIFPILLLYGW